MSVPIPPDLWDKLCAFLATHETCQVILHQHQGRVYMLDLGVVKERVKAGPLHEKDDIDKHVGQRTLVVLDAG